jgi:hypothetical protein
LLHFVFLKNEKRGRQCKWEGDVLVWGAERL